MLRQLGKPYSVVDDCEKTKDRILMASARMFALHGYSTISVREIAVESGIQPAAIYNHYQGKKDILFSILDKGIELLSRYYESLLEANIKAACLEDIVDNMFVELKYVTTDFIYYSLCIANHTQFLFQKSRHLHYDLFLVEGCKRIKSHLDLAVARQFAAPCDTAAVASLISSSVMNCNTIRVGHFNGYYQDFDFDRWYDSQAKLVLQMMQYGN